MSRFLAHQLDVLEEPDKPTTRPAPSDHSDSDSATGEYEHIELGTGEQGESIVTSHTGEYERITLETTDETDIPAPGA